MGLHTAEMSQPMQNSHSSNFGSKLLDFLFNYLTVTFIKRIDTDENDEDSFLRYNLRRLFASVGLLSRFHHDQEESIVQYKKKLVLHAHPVKILNWSEECRKEG